MIDADLVDAFIAQVDAQGSKIKRSLAAAVRLWVALPQDVQTRLQNQSLGSDAFIELVQQIVDDRIDAGRKAAQKLLRRRHKKRNPKD
ncbi:MAG: hypothetical protein ACYTEQ_21595 [Planctomycetota bacterium]